MTISLDDLVAAEVHTPDFKRDRWGRPSIMQPDGKRKGYTRCSSAAKTIEDTYNLERYARRNTAYGLAYDTSLVARLIAIGGAPDTWTKEQKDEVNAIVEAADAVAKAHKRADIGSAIHHMTHRVDRGETVNAGPYQADIDAYRAAMKQANLAVFPQYIECRMVNDDLEMAGTADRIVLYNGLDVYRIADIKTGATIDFGGLGWSAQLAAYAGGLLYDVTLEQRIETPPIDRKTGLIIHLPAGEGRCDIYEVDIAQGLMAARLANDIREVRKQSKGWITPCLTTTTSSSVDPTSMPSTQQSTTNEPTTPTNDSTNLSITPSTSKTTSTAPDDAWRFEAKRRYDLLSDEQRAEYTARKQTIDTSNPDQVFALLDDIEPFNTVIAPEPVPPLSQTSPAPAHTPDEGDTVNPATIAALRRAFEALPDAAQLWISTLTAQGRTAGLDWRTGAHPSVRRYELGRAVIKLAGLLED